MKGSSLLITQRSIFNQKHQTCAYMCYLKVSVMIRLCISIAVPHQATLSYSSVQMFSDIWSFICISTDIMKSFLWKTKGQQSNNKCIV